MMGKVAFTGGGSAGHLFPGMAVISAMNRLEQNNTPEVYWIAGIGGMEVEHLKAAGITTYTVPVGKLRRYFSLQNFIDLFKVAAGVVASIVLFLRRRPALLFCKGGFVSVPPALAATILRIPIITHESDLHPGLATRIVSRFARRILLSYPETFESFSRSLQKRTTVTGNPIRSQFYEVNREEARRSLSLKSGDIFLLVLGGSQGAAQINSLIRQIAPELLPHCRILHQMGRPTYEESTLPGYQTVEQIGEELPNIVAAADVVVGRAGAGTIWELATLKKPMVLIPLGTGSSRGDQLANAEYIRLRGGAAVLTGDVTPDELQDSLYSLITSSERRSALSRGCRGFSGIRGDIAIAEILLAEYCSLVGKLE